MDYFSSLPEGCTSDVLSLTSPRDVCRSSAISRGFRSAAESDTTWERFLPSDYQQIISRSVSPVVFTTKKDLYFRLCDTPILLDDGKMSFSLDKETGKKCYMLRAKELIISWEDTPYYWKWTSHPDSRFSEVAELLAVCWLDIRGKMETHMLSLKTTYAAYLVFKLAEWYYGIDSVKVYVRLNREVDEFQAEDEAITVCLKSETSRRAPGQLPKERKDGWMEIEMGEFYNDQGDAGEVEMRLIEIKRLDGKSGLIVEGMELRPKENR
uniref:Putative F-box protein PP2-B10-like isoform X1 n=1 Tax=Davidia involucrata TaxID=16924 RepID=A0A5B6ZDP6_DAVIN